MASSAPKLILDDDERFALMKFRRCVAEVLEPHHNDYFLVRWLRARSWNAEAAEKMLRESLQWRKRWHVDTKLKIWEPPEPLATYYPSGISGCDKEGVPVIIIPFGGLDIVGLLHSVSKQDMMKLTIKILETTLDLAIKNGNYKVVAIFDLDGFNLRQYAWRPAVELIISLIQMYEANYPEILKHCYLINAPRVFSIAFSVVKKFLNEYTLSKIQIYKADPKKWQKALRENISPSEFPKYYGGEMVDSNGDPKCSSKIRQGGKIPKSYYSHKFDDRNIFGNKEHVSTVIRKGRKFSIDFIIAEKDCYLRWDFRTEGHDIRFGITYRGEDESTQTAVRLHRVPSHLVDQAGVIECQAPATYTVLFDNTYSYFRNKKLQYSISITQPLNEIDVSSPDAELVFMAAENKSETSTAIGPGAPKNLSKNKITPNLDIQASPVTMVTS